MKVSNEMKAGLVILAGILVAVFFLFKTTNFQSEPYELKTYFNYAGDLKPDATVKLSGIEVGRVVKIEFIYGEETKVECTLSLDRKAKIRKDAVAYVGTSGFVGDAYVGLTPGTLQDFFKPNEVIGSEDPVQMRDIMKKAKKIADDMDATLLEVKTLASNANGLLSDNREHIDEIVVNIEASTQNFKEFTEDVKKHPWKLLFKGE